MVGLLIGTTAGTVASGDDARITGALQRAGGIMTGDLKLKGDPTEALMAATKQYVDANAPDFGAGNAALAFGAIGTYVFALKTAASGTSTLTFTAGSTYAGSSLQLAWVASYGTANANVHMEPGEPTLSGTWRAMGQGSYAPASSTVHSIATLLMRVA